MRASIYSAIVGFQCPCLDHDAIKHGGVPSFGAGGAITSMSILIVLKTP